MKTPRFLHGVTIHADEEAALEHDLRNWLVLCDSLKNFPPTTVCEHLKKLMFYEFHHNNRSDILRRLHSRYNTFRRKQELAEIEFPEEFTDARKED
jgi:hypothetical protein